MIEDSQQLTKDFKEIFSSKAGKNVLEYLKKLSGYNYSKMVDSPIDIYRVVANEAQRAVVCMIVQRIEMVLDSDKTEQAITKETKE